MPASLGFKVENCLVLIKEFNYLIKYLTERKPLSNVSINGSTYFVISYSMKFYFT